MDFECDFNNANFCHYSSQGWGFQKSLLIANDQYLKFNNQNLEATSSSPESRKSFSLNYFPCTDSQYTTKVPILDKVIPNNLTDSFCLKIGYFLEREGSITIKNSDSHWSSKSSNNKSQTVSSSAKWNYLTVPIFTTSNQKKNQNSLLLFPYDEVRKLEISGHGLCIDNITKVPNTHCSLITTEYRDIDLLKNTGNTLNGTNSYNNGFGSFFGNNFMLTGPMSLLICLIAVIMILLLSGLISSLCCVAKTTLFGDNNGESGNGNKRRNRLGNLMGKSKYNNNNNNGFNSNNYYHHHRTIDSCLDNNDDDDSLDILGNNNSNVASQRVFCHNCVLPTVVNVRNNPQSQYYPSPLPRQSVSMLMNNSFSNQNNETRFSLALTEDAQIQILSNSSQQPLPQPHQLQQQQQPTCSNYINANDESISSTIVQEISPSSSNNPRGEDIVIFNNATSSSNNYQVNKPVKRPNSIAIPIPITEQFRMSNNSTTIANADDADNVNNEEEVDDDIEELDLVYNSTEILQDEIELGASSNINCDQRTRPIRESLNIGYISDNSDSCGDLPHYDDALKLLAATKQSDLLKLSPSHPHSPTHITDVDMHAQLGFNDTIGSCTNNIDDNSFLIFNSSTCLDNNDTNTINNSFNETDHYSNAENQSINSSNNNMSISEYN